MSTSVTEDEWGSATLYEGGRPIEPRTFVEADPLAVGVLVPDWDAPLADEGRAGEHPALWSDTTYVGKPRRRADRHRVADPGAAGSGVALPDTSEADSPVDPTVAVGAAAVEAGAGAGAADADADADAESSNRRMLAASGSMAVASLVSRVSGFVRSILLIAALGSAAVGNSYNAGNNLPNMIYELLLGGVLSSVLIPLLVQAQARDADQGVAYTQRLLSIATTALAAVTVLAVAAAPWIAAAFVPSGPQRVLTSIFATLLLPEIFFYGLGAMFIAVLNIRHVYKPGAWSPVLNNAIMIVTIAVFFALPGPDDLNPASITTPQVLVLGIGTTAGIAAQALVLIPALRRSGFTWQWRFRARPDEKGRLGEIGTLAGWVLGYVVISQIGVTVIQKVGIDNGGFSIFTWTDLLFQMPYGILVVSLLTAIMPRMSRAAVQGDNVNVVADLSLAARLSAVALVPVTFGLIVLGPSMCVGVFSFGHQSIERSELIGSSLAWSAFGLFPFALVMLQLRVFYAMHDGRTPTVINAFMVGVKVALILVTNAVYAAPPGTHVNSHPSVRAVEWLNIATSVSYVVGAIVGHIVLTRRLGRLGFGSVVRTVGQIAVASAIGAAAAYAVVRLAHSLLGEARLGAITGFVLGAVVGLIVMGVVTWRMRIPDLVQLLANARRSRPRESAEA